MEKIKENFHLVLLFVLIVVNGLVGGYSDLLSSGATITGVICVILAAKGSIYNYHWGAINCVLYAIVAYNSKLYGDAMLNMFYSLPLQFIGIYLWKKESEKAGGDYEDNFKMMTTDQKIKLSIVSIISILIYSVFLKSLGGNTPLLDSTSTVFSVIAMILLLKMYTEQWIFWLMINIVSIVMWIFPLLRGEDSAISMMVMWIAYLINSIYGYLNWKNMSTKNDTKEIS